MQFSLIALAVVFALQIVGIPLTAFAIFGGALGLGVGLGLQRAASNIISGLMLLMDKSIKPGDVIAIGSTFGWVYLAWRALCRYQNARRYRAPDTQ